MAANLHALSDLSAYLTDYISSVYQLDDVLFRNSITRNLQNSIFRERYTFTKARFDVNFFISKTEQRTFLFLFNEARHEERVLIKAKISFDFVPVADQNLQAEAWKKSKNKLPDKYFWNLPYPDFFSQIKSLKKDTDADTFFRYDEAIRTWITRAADGDQEEQLNLDTSAMNEDENEVLKMTRLLLSSFQQLHAAHIRLQESRAARLNALFREGGVAYQIANFNANVVLSLDEEGQLAENEKQEYFNLKMNYGMSFQEKEIVTQLKMAPPDFLAGGKLYSDFLNCILKGYVVEGPEALEDEEELTREERNEEKADKGKPPITKIIRKMKKMGCSENDVLAVFNQALDGGGSIYRIKKKRKYDVNLFVLQGRVGARDLKIVFKGNFIVKPDDPLRPVRLKRKVSLKVLYNPKTNEIDKKAVKYFSRIFIYLENWINLL